MVRGSAARHGRRVRIYREARVGLGSDGTHRAYALYHDVPDFEPLVHTFEYCTPILSSCYEVGTPFPADPMSAANRVVRSDLNITRLILRMECRSNSSMADIRPCGPSDHGGGFGVARARITLNDALPPVVDTATGPLTTSGAMLEGVQAVTVAARDLGGGLERLAVVVDGSVAMTAPLVDVAPACRQPYAKVVPCAGSVTRTLAFDSGDGAQRLPLDPNRRLRRSRQSITVIGRSSNDPQWLDAERRRGDKAGPDCCEDRRSQGTGRAQASDDGLSSQANDPRSSHRRPRKTDLLGDC